MLRPHRAGRRLRRRCDAHDGAQGGRRLRPQRPEELDLVCGGRRPRARLREDGPRREAQGHLRLRARKGDARAFRAGDRAQARRVGRLDRRAPSSRTSRCPPRTSSARRARASRSPCTASTRAASRSRPAPAASSAPASNAPSSTRASVRPSASRSARTSSCRTVAQMVLDYETSKLLVMQAAWLEDQGVRNTRETSLAKWHATECAFQAAHLAIQVHGAYGYSGEYGIERCTSATPARPSSTRARRRFTRCCRPSMRSDTATSTAGTGISPRSPRGRPRSSPARADGPRARGRGAAGGRTGCGRAADRRNVHARRELGRHRLWDDQGRGARDLGAASRRVPGLPSDDLVLQREPVPAGGRRRGLPQRYRRGPWRCIGQPFAENRSNWSAWLIAPPP